MADFVRFADDENMSSDQKMSLAVSGWLLGAGVGDDQSGRRHVAVQRAEPGCEDYLTTEQIHRRDEILQELQTLEGSSPRYLTQLIAHMKPPLATTPDEAHLPGSFELSVPGLAEQPEITYEVQLPPEYDPYRPLSLHRDAERRGHDAAAASRLVGRWLQRTGTDAIGAGHASRLHRDRAHWTQAASTRVRVHGPRTCGRAVFAPRCVPPILD